MDHPDLYELARLRVKPRTLREYHQALQVFVNWLPEELGAVSASKMDELLNSFAHHIYREREGQGLSLVSKAKAGIEFYFPKYVGRLVQSGLSLQGWRTVTKTTAHPVCPEEVAYLLAQELLKMGYPDAAVATLLIFDTYMRIGDLLGLKTSDVVILDTTKPDQEHYAALQIEVNKRGEKESILVRPLFLCKLLARWKARRLLTLQEEGPLLGIGGSSYRRILQDALSRLGLAALKITPHTLRYGGATTDLVYSRLSKEQVKSRGRWKQDKTFQHYVQVKTCTPKCRRYPPPG